ncbi:aldo/keto reductase [Rhizophagus irregularis DAOM 181602=DAOM 197198]|nr:aldo/keto reductase [Rhizophagus irregularis DAOM 181602=DAOM 197198]
MALPTRELGKTGVQVPVIGLGCMGMSDFFGSSDEKENINVLNKSIDLGSYFWDTADMYGCGANEELVSKVLKERRNEVFICTKFGIIRGPNGEFEGIRGDREYIHQACEKSLKRLGVDYIDLYYQIRVDINTPIEETVSAMAELVKEGKVKHLGLSECSAETLRRACKVHPIAALQIEYSPWTLDIEQNGIIDACRELGDHRKVSPRFMGDNFAKNWKIVEKINEFAAKKGIAPSQLCLAWVLAQGDNIITIPGTKKIKYLEENIKAVNVHLSPEELSEIRSIINSIEIIGLRYPEEHCASLNL